VKGSTVARGQARLLHLESGWAQPSAPFFQSFNPSSIHLPEENAAPMPRTPMTFQSQRIFSPSRPVRPFPFVFLPVELCPF